MSFDSTSTLLPATRSESAMARAVRFDKECVLIPEPPPRSRRPRIVMKSYSLPLWNKKMGGSAVSDSEAEPSEDGQIFFKVSVPKIITKSPSFSRDEKPASPLQPCLVRQDSPRLTRRASAPLSPRSDLMTVPLRACCMECVPIMEESMKEGQEWKERFTRGARRRRSASSSSADFVTMGGHNHGEHGPSGTFHARLISVDEVDKRRKSSESTDDARGSLRAQDTILSLNEDVQTACGSSSVSKRASDSAPPTASASVVTQSPIKEEDEEQLFPLPSPRRTPTSSPVPSPNTSSSCLSPRSIISPDSPDPFVRSTSTDSISDESGASTTTKRERLGGRCEKGLLTPADSYPSPPLGPSEYLNSVFSPSESILISSSLSRRPPSPTLATSSSPSSFRPRNTTGVRSRSSSPARIRRKPSFQLHLPGPGSLLRAGTDLLKGVSALSGPPMSA